MKTEDLNGHYCLATKANYDMLVEDGIGTIFSSLEEQRTRNDGKYIIVIDNVILLVWAINNHEVPMHLEKNEWVEGSLEHKETRKDIVKRYMDNKSKYKILNSRFFNFIESIHKDGDWEYEDGSQMKDDAREFIDAVKALAKDEN